MKSYKKKGHRLGREEVTFHQDNAQPHHELRYELLQHPPYSAPSDFSFFLKLKIFLRERRFSTIEELTAKVEGYFASLEESHFQDGIKVLEHRTKCISLQGDYVEK